MSKDSSNNDDLKDFLIDENPEEVEKRIKNDEKNTNSEKSPGPWGKKNTVNEKKDNSSSIKNNKKSSASKNYFILILIVCAGLGFIIYQINNNESLVKKDEKNESDNRKLIELHTSELWKVEFLAKWSEHFTDTMIINLTNKTNYTIKELEFWFMDKKCSDLDSNSNDWTNRIQETFLVNFEPNQKLAIKKNDLDRSKNWCYRLDRVKGY